MRFVAILALVAALLIPTQAKASLVLDNFSNTTAGPVTVFTNGSVSLQRTTSGFSLLSPGSFISFGGGLTTISYSVTGGTFNDLSTSIGAGLTYPFRDFFLGATGGSADFTASATWVGGTASSNIGATSGVFSILDEATLGTGSSIVYSFTGSSGYAVGAGGLVATPEPTSLVMFGLVAGGGFLARRRALKSKKLAV